MTDANNTKKTLVAVGLVLVVHLFAHSQFSPADISGLSLWLRADSGVTLNGNHIVQWDDQSGNANHCTSEFDVIRPVLLENAINGLPAASFDGIEDFMVFPELNNVRTVFWVLRENAGATGSPPRPLLGWSGGLTYLRGDNEEIWDESFSDPAVHNGTTRLNMQSVDATSTLVPSDFCLVSLVTTAPVNASHLTMELNIFGRTWWGEMAEILIYDTPLNESEILAVENYLADKYTAAFAVTPDVLIPYGFCETSLCAPEGFESYTWNNIPGASCINLSESGDYILAVQDAFDRIFNDTISVIYPGNLNIPGDTICMGESFEWDTNLNEEDYDLQWSSGAETAAVTLSAEGDYTLTATDSASCSRQIFFHLETDEFATLATLGEDRQLCAGNTIGLTEPMAGLTYLWSTGEFTPAISVSESGTYWLEATNALGCVMLDSVVIEIVGIAPEITMAASNLCATDAVSFTANNPGNADIISWQWNFGDEQTGGGENTTHVFGTAGEYEIMLEVQTSDGCNASVSQLIHIAPKPTPLFTTSQVCNNAPVALYDNSSANEGELLSWLWIVDEIAYEGSQVNVSISQTGSHDIYLEVTNSAGCSQSLIQSIEVLAAPVSAFTADATCVGDLTQFAETVDTSESGPIAQYAWNFGDNTGSSSQDPAHFYPQDGSYSVELIAFAQNGCSDTLVQPVVIHALPVADFVVSNACLDQPYTLVGSSESGNDPVTTWYWETNDDIYTTENPVVVFTATGLHPVLLSVTTENGCTGSVQQQIPVWASPVAAFTYAPLIGEAPSPVQFTNESSGATDATWLFGDTHQSDDYNPLHIFTLNGTFYTQLIVTNTAGCRDTTGQIIQVAAPVLDLMIQSVQCQTTDLGQQIHVELVNTGNIVIDQFIIGYQVGNDAPVLEAWTGVFAPGSSMEYTFHAYMQVAGHQFPYVCITADTSPLEYTETNLTDNQYCKPLRDTGLEVFPPYPNPGDDRMFVRFLTPAAGDLELYVYDVKGNLVMDLTDEQVPAGYHQYFLDISALAEGHYKLQLVLGDSKSVVAFMKIRPH